ncbi:hypothetical protein [Hymenobacter profundi]|uniref:Uncharacterized protein n=1 Tax=Hymenobacter profundi TaxID=1982110 RepID=A0ABS6X1J4_9BACT|nr:hypothetical protein [Hymenobacter profundi]MBW3129711.1 hypothetical protein [Hymenobacter profundi]
MKNGTPSRRSLRFLLGKAAEERNLALPVRQLLMYPVANNDLTAAFQN